MSSADLDPYEEDRNRIRSLAAMRDVPDVRDLSESVLKLVNETRYIAEELAIALELLGLHLFGDKNPLYALLEQLKPNQYGRVYVTTDDPDSPTDIELNDLPNFTLELKSMVRHFGVSPMDVTRFRRESGFSTGDDGRASHRYDYYTLVEIPCSHPEGCPHTQQVRCKNPRDMVNAEIRAGREVWYCETHEAQGWSREKQISDIHLINLERIGQLGTTTLTGAFLNPQSMRHLKDCGLIDVEQPGLARGSTRYKIGLSKDGHDLLKARAQALLNVKENARYLL